MSMISSMRVTDLRCEYTRNPLGIDVRNPRFSWALQDERRGQRQTAYQLIVASSPHQLDDGVGDKWDSGRVVSDEQVHIVYAGQPLRSAERCYWRVCVWDCDGQVSAWSDSAWFEMGLLDESDWTSLWFGYPAGQNGKALYFRSFFEVTKPVKWARAYVSGLGLYELYLNGGKANDRVLEPAQTEYAKRVFYTTVDITPLLRQGWNCVGALVGNGWYPFPKLRAQLHIEYEDGTVLLHHTSRVATMPAVWLVASSPILTNSLYDGEVYHARLERPHWCEVEDARVQPADPHRHWFQAVPVDAPAGHMVAQPMEPIRVTQDLAPVSVCEPAPGVYVYDMGQNMVGWVQLRVQGPRDTVVSLKFSENIDDDGTVDQGNLRGAACTDTYILKGEGLEVWEPRFTYHGFRYVQVEGFPGKPGMDTVQGRVVHSDVAPRGHFECSNALINRLQRAVLWTESGNLHGLPTDCPQRDERMGWLNDMTVRAEEANYNFDVNRLHAKWIGDIHDAQDPNNGAIPDTAPFRMGMRPADPVTMCYLLAPWLLYQHYGNRQVMAEHYAGFRRWVDYLSTRANDDIVEFSYYGDWSPPVDEAVRTSIGAGAVSAATPGALVSTAYYYYGTLLLSQMASVLGEPGEAEALRARAGQIRAAYNWAFWNDAQQVYGSGNQACCCLSLYMDLVPAERRATVLDTLVRDVEAHEYHLTTGNLCSKYLLEVLSALGRHDVAYRLITQTTYPSWGYMLACGATTIWERWEHTKETGMHSKNHPMMATFSAWLYRFLAGIQLEPDAVGFDRFRIRPHLVGDLEFATASVETMRGQVTSAWQRNADGLCLRVTVPVNTSAHISVPKLGQNAIAESGTVLWRDGKTIATVPGIAEAYDDGQWVTFIAGSGAYVFETVKRGIEGE
ncbi:MAG: glycoside hydrolase family 78 protein [Chloroflexi bacterium]|nr:glycoside hydrolase family 78 protein [Chloroflexota bacterium]